MQQQKEWPRRAPFKREESEMTAVRNNPEETKAPDGGSAPYITWEMPIAKRREVSKSFLFEWLGQAGLDAESAEMFKTLAMGIEKGYYVVSHDGLLMLTSKGAWRENTRRKQGR